MKLFVGTSGTSYEEGPGSFYPEELEPADHCPSSGRVHPRVAEAAQPYDHGRSTNPPAGYHRSSPYLNYEDTGAMLEWLAGALVRPNVPGRPACAGRPDIRTMDRHR